MLVSKLLSLLSPDAREIMSIWFFAFSGLPFAVRGFSGEFQYYSTSASSGLDLGPKAGVTRCSDCKCEAGPLALPAQ